MKLLRCIPLLLSICALLHVNACGGGGPQTENAGSGQQPAKPAPAGSLQQAGVLPSEAPRALLAGLPALSSLRGTSAALENNFLDAAQYSSISAGGATTNGLDLLLDAPPATLAFGIYVLDITPQITQRWLDLLLTYPDGTPEDEPVWVALADFAAGRWELHDVRSEGSTFDLGAPRYLSTGQTISFALLAHDGGTVTCEGIYLIAGELNSPPLAVLEADVSAGAAPLLVNFDASGSSDSDGNISSYRWDYDGDGIADEFTTQPLASHSYNGGGTFTARVKVSDVYSDEGSAELTITVNGGNQSPTAGLLVLPDSVEINEALVLDGSNSSDPDGSIVNFEWDTDGDGVFETDTDGLDSTAGFVFNSGGVRTMRLRVTDDDGATATASAPVTVHGWSDPLVPLPGLSGQSYCSPAMVEGRPAFSYTSPNNSVRYVRAADAYGDQWGSSVRVSNSNGVYFSSSMELVDGRPAVAFWHTPTERIRFVRADDAEGASWPDPLTVLDVAEAYNVRMLDFNGMPAIGYLEQDTFPGEIKFIRSNAADGSTWLSPLFVANTIGSFATAIIDGRPAFSYGELSTSKPLFLRSSDDSGAQWNGSPEVMTSYPADDLYFDSVLTDVGSGRPLAAATIVDASTSQLSGVKVFLGDVNAQNWETIQTFAPDEGFYPALTVVDGHPTLLYGADLDGDGLDSVFFAEASDANGAAWLEAEDLGLQLDNLLRIQVFDNAGSPAVLVEHVGETLYLYRTP